MDWVAKRLAKLNNGQSLVCGRLDWSTILTRTISTAGVFEPEFRLVWVIPMLVSLSQGGKTLPVLTQLYRSFKSWVSRASYATETLGRLLDRHL